jgi:hypothetical protein
MYDFAKYFQNKYEKYNIKIIFSMLLFEYV